MILDLLGSGMSIKEHSCHVLIAKNSQHLASPPPPDCAINVAKVNKLKGKGKLEFTKQMEWKQATTIFFGRVGIWAPVPPVKTLLSVYWIPPTSVALLAGSHARFTGLFK